VAEREQALMRQSVEARAERLAAARKRVELFSTPAATRPKVEPFSAAGGSAGAGASKPRIELFGASPRPINSNNARTTEEA
jgi:chemotaxis protein CheD